MDEVSDIGPLVDLVLERGHPGAILKGLFDEGKCLRRIRKVAAGAALGASLLAPHMAHTMDTYKLTPAERERSRTMDESKLTPAERSRILCKVSPTGGDPVCFVQTQKEVDAFQAKLRRDDQRIKARIAADPDAARAERKMRAGKPLTPHEKARYAQAIGVHPSELDQDE